MHTLVRRYLKTGVAFLVIGLLIGAVMIVRREYLGVFPDPYVTSAHAHAILVGFVMMMILGVALWMFPRPDKADTRYSAHAAEAAYWLVTTGTATRIAGELLHGAQAGPALRFAVALAGIIQTAGVLLFFWTMWSRIRPAGSRGREGQGERF